MKKLTVLWPILALVAVSCTQEKVDVSRLVKNYAVVTIPAPDLTGITDNGKEVLMEKPFLLLSRILQRSCMLKSTMVLGTALPGNLSFVVMAINPPEPVSIRRI